MSMWLPRTVTLVLPAIPCSETIGRRVPLIFRLRHADKMAGFLVHIGKTIEGKTVQTHFRWSRRKRHEARPPGR